MTAPALVLSSDGEPLAEATVSLPASGASARAVLRPHGPQGLVRYYFARGGREVVLRGGDGSRWRGRIVGTRWQPQGRLWYLVAG